MSFWYLKKKLKTPENKRPPNPLLLVWNQQVHHHHHHCNSHNSRFHILDHLLPSTVVGPQTASQTPRLKYLFLSSLGLVWDQLGSLDKTCLLQNILVSIYNTVAKLSLLTLSFHLAYIPFSFFFPLSVL